MPATAQDKEAGPAAGGAGRPEAAAQKPPARRGVFLLLTALWLLWITGRIARDRSLLTAFLFYLPSPFVAGILMAYALWSRMRGRRLRAFAAGLLAMAPLFMVLCVENRWSRPPPAPSDRAPLRLVHWNVGRGWLGRRGVMAALRRREADLYVLSEAPPYEETDRLARGFGAGYTALRLSDMMLIARGRLLRIGRPETISGLVVIHVRWEYRGEAISLFAADITADLHRARMPRLRNLVALIRTHRPDLVVGDLNAPRRSRALRPLPEGYAHAYDVAGRGWSYTWPMPLPVLDTDQCIVGPRIQARRYALVTDVHSDHRMQVLDFSVRRATDGT